MKFSISKDEWETAKVYLEKAKNGTKLPYSSIKIEDNLLPRPNKEKLYHAIAEHNQKNPESALAQTNHSFIKINEKIYAMAQGKKDATLGKGSFGTVKYIQDENGNIAVVKIEEKENNSEGIILQDLFHLTNKTDEAPAKSAGKVKRIDKEKYYTHLVFAGKTLDKILNSSESYELVDTPEKPIETEIKPNKIYCYPQGDVLHYLLKRSTGEIVEKTLPESALPNSYAKIRTKLKNKQDISQSEYESLELVVNNSLPPLLTNEQRMNIAIGLCLQVFCLHTGRLSKSNTAYAHLDLKPANVTVDEQGNVHLIDFGLSEKAPYGIKVSQPNDAASYLPTPTSQEQGRTRQQFDMLALKRTLFMPKSIFLGREVTSYEGTERRSVLNDELLDQNNLRQYIDTSSTLEESEDFSNDDLTPEVLAALLIAKKLNLAIADAELRTNIQKALIITTNYLRSNNSEEAKKAIELVLDSASEIPLHAALEDMDCLSKKQVYIDDENLNRRLKQSKSHAEACALIYLKDHNLAEHYQKVHNDPELAQAIFNLIKLKHPVTAEVFQNSTLVKAINLAREAKMQNHLPQIMASPDLCQAIVSIANQKTSLQKLKSELDKTISDEKAIAYCNIYQTNFAAEVKSNLISWIQYSLLDPKTVNYLVQNNLHIILKDEPTLNRLKSILRSFIKENLKIPSDMLTDKNVRDILCESDSKSTWHAAIILFNQGLLNQDRAFLLQNNNEISSIIINFNKHQFTHKDFVTLLNNENIFKQLNSFFLQNIDPNLIREWLSYPQLFNKEIYGVEQLKTYIYLARNKLDISADYSEEQCKVFNNAHQLGVPSALCRTILTSDLSFCNYLSTCKDRLQIITAIKTKNKSLDYITLTQRDTHPHLDTLLDFAETREQAKFCVRMSQHLNKLIQEKDKLQKLGNAEGEVAALDKLIRVFENVRVDNPKNDLKNLINQYKKELQDNKSFLTEHKSDVGSVNWGILDSGLEVLSLVFTIGILYPAMSEHYSMGNRYTFIKPSHTCSILEEIDSFLEEAHREISSVPVHDTNSIMTGDATVQFKNTLQELKNSATFFAEENRNRFL